MVRVVALLTLFLCTATGFSVRELPATPRLRKINRGGSTTTTNLRMTSLPELAAVCTVPTLLGLWKREYGVSYAYGIAMAASAAVVIASESLTGLSRWHAYAHLAYGLRLCAFLLWRELYVPKFRELREKIEKRAPVEKGTSLPRRLFSRVVSRAPFILGCSLLYFCMSLPLLSSARCPSPHSIVLVLPLLVLAYAGLAVAAIGDLHKSLAKARRGERALVTSGLYALLRHPNYTGEQVLWAASALVGILLSTPLAFPLKTLSTWAAILLGQLGIQFVLMQATTSLNKRQRETYANESDYQKWRAFAGFELKTEPSTSEAPPQRQQQEQPPPSSPPPEDDDDQAAAKDQDEPVVPSEERPSGP